MTSFCLSVDVEEDLPGLLPYGTKGIEQGLPALFDVLADSRIHGDFFFSTPIVKEYPDTVRDAIRLGHGIGNHGMDHGLLCSKPLDQQRKEIQSSSRILMDVSGSTPLMFRAPNFSVDSSTLSLSNTPGGHCGAGTAPRSQMVSPAISPHNIRPSKRVDSAISCSCQSQQTWGKGLTRGACNPKSTTAGRTVGSRGSQSLRPSAPYQNCQNYD